MYESLQKSLSKIKNKLNLIKKFYATNSRKILQWLRKISQKYCSMIIYFKYIYLKEYLEHFTFIIHYVLLFFLQQYLNAHFSFYQLLIFFQFSFLRQLYFL